MERFATTKLTAARFAVRVQGLPRNATAKAVADHFSRLYDLSEQDWRVTSTPCCCRMTPRPPLVSKGRVKTQLRKAGALREAWSRGPRTSTASSGEESSDVNDDTQHVYSELAPGALPVLDVSNSGDGHLIGSWVAEASLVQPVARHVASYKAVMAMEVWRATRACPCELTSLR